MLVLGVFYNISILMLLLTVSSVATTNTMQCYLFQAMLRPTYLVTNGMPFCIVSRDVVQEF